MKEHDSERIRVLVVDDHPIIRASVAVALGDEFDVFQAANSIDTNNLLKLYRFGYALIDVVMEGRETGIELSKQYRKLYPHMAVGLFTANPERLYKSVGIVADDCLEKTIGINELREAVKNGIWLKTMPDANREKMFSALRWLLPYQRAVRFVSRTGDETGAERIDCVLTADGEPIASSVYNLPGVNERRNVIGIASTVGCVGKCLFCGSGQKKFKRKLSLPELAGQFVYGIKSYHARGVFEGQKDLVVSFTTEGDALFSNLDNCCELVSVLSQLKGIDLSFIMTTIGHEYNLRRFLEQYIYLPITFYWSVNFLNDEQRAKFMPGTIGQSLTAQRDLFQAIAEKTGRPVTVSYILIKGVNDRYEDVQLMKYFFGGRPFKVKIMALEEGSLKGFGKTPDEDVNRFSELLKEAGLECRIRRIVGGGIKAGCGTTIPREIL